MGYVWSSRMGQPCHSVGCHTSDTEIDHYRLSSAHGFIRGQARSDGRNALLDKIEALDEMNRSDWTRNRRECGGQAAWRRYGRLARHSAAAWCCSNVPFITAV